MEDSGGQALALRLQMDGYVYISTEGCQHSRAILKDLSRDIRPIDTKADDKAALKVVAALVVADSKRGTPGADRPEVLGALLEAYEAQHYPVELPDPIEAIKFRMEQEGLGATDFTSLIGGLIRETA